MLHEFSYMLFTWANMYIQIAWSNINMQITWANISDEGGSFEVINVNNH